jgi:DNA (cytosine-5)-methyltransferase 1
MNKISFQKWLIEVKNFQARSATDVMSRINRVSRFQKLPESIDENFVSTLAEKEEYLKLSPSVRSQLKRALRLYKEYTE